MSRHRFFVSSALPEGDGPVALPLSPMDVHHAARVLRLQPGECIVAVEPGGRSHVVKVQTVTAEGLIGRVLEDVAGCLEPHITLVQGIIKGSGMEQTVRHAVELGAERIVPLLTERTVVRLQAEKIEARTARWQRIAEGAARQSQRARIPVVECPTTVERLASEIEGFDAAVVLWEEADAEGLAEVLEAAGVNVRRPESRVALVVGPEGGLTPEEVSALSAAGVLVASLGGAVLRAQTAALAAVTLTANALGAL